MDRQNYIYQWRVGTMRGQPLYREVRGDQINKELPEDVDSMISQNRIHEFPLPLEPAIFDAVRRFRKDLSDSYLARTSYGNIRNYLQMPNAQPAKYKRGTEITAESIAYLTKLLQKSEQEAQEIRDFQKYYLVMKGKKVGPNQQQEFKWADLQGLTPYMVNTGKQISYIK